MQPGVESGLSLGPFFHDEIAAAKRELGVELSPEAEMYTVQLLVRYATLAVDVVLDRPLALQWADANEIREPWKRRTQFLRLGDAALLRNGFLCDPEGERVSWRYVGSVGRTAYTEVARLSSKAASAAFEMVVASFELLCQLMLEIRMKYAKWEPAAFVLIGQRTPSSTAARRLSESGLILLDEAEA